MPDLTPTQRATLTHHARKLRDALDQLERGATRATPKVRKLIRAIGGTAPGHDRLAHTADISHGVRADQLAVYARMVLEEVDAVLGAG